MPTCCFTRLAASAAQPDTALCVQLVPVPPPWKPAEVLDILLNKWRSDFAELAGSRVSDQKAAAEQIMGLKRQLRARDDGRRKWLQLAGELLLLLHTFSRNIDARRDSPVEGAHLLLLLQLLRQVLQLWHQQLTSACILGVLVWLCFTYKCRRLTCGALLQATCRCTGCDVAWRQR